MPLTRHILFLPSLWAALLSAIVCAVVPAGLPATRSFGSAFDPSTTIVALRSRPPVVGRADQLEDDGGGGGGATLPTPMSPRMAIATVGLALVAVEPRLFPELVVPLVASVPDPTHYARPPPVL